MDAAAPPREVPSYSAFEIFAAPTPRAVSLTFMAFKTAEKPEGETAEDVLQTRLSAVCAVTLPWDLVAALRDQLTLQLEQWVATLRRPQSEEREARH